jgi:hypothetical protein
MRKAFVVPLLLAVVMAGGYGFISIQLRAQDTNLSGYLSGLMLQFWGGEQNQLIRVNLHNYSIALYERGTLYKIARIAAPGNPDDGTRTPTGKFRVLSKDAWHISGSLVMPWAVRFNGPYYFHAIPVTKKTNEIVHTAYSHGCIRLPDPLAEQVFNWANIGAYVEVYDASLARADDGAPTVYLLTFDGHREPIASADVFAARGYHWNDVAVIPAVELAAMPVGATIE